MLIPLKDDNPLHRIGFQYVTALLIATCVVVWLFQFQGGDSLDSQLVFRYGLIPGTILGDLERRPDMALATPWLTVLTSMFLHGGFWHLLGNMLYLWVFGDNVEDSMGHGRFAFFYLVCGAVAGLAHAAADPGSATPTIGASGAVSGVLGAYFMLYPKRGVWMLVYVVPVRFPAWSVLGVWIAGQLIHALTFGATGGGVAWYAHIGGFITGALLVIPLRKPELQLPHLERSPFGPWSHPRPSRKPSAAPWGPTSPRRDKAHESEKNAQTELVSVHDTKDQGGDGKRDDPGPWGKASRRLTSRYGRVPGRGKDPR